jgi:YndJ-like protein
MNYLNSNNNWLTNPLHPLGVWLKLSVLAFVYILLKSSPSQPTWVVILVLFAALFLVPIGFQQISQRQSMFRMDANGLVLHMPCTLLLAMSFLTDRGILAGVFALPYATWCVETLLRGLKRSKCWVYFVTVAIFLGLAIGSLWLLLGRFGIQPLGFSNWIVILKSVHFHYAGFTLLTSLVLFLYEESDDKQVIIVSMSIIFGVLFMGIGVALTHLGFYSIYETFAGIWLGISSMAAGFIFIKKSLLEKKITKILWFLGGLCLVLDMILACFYVWSSVILLDILTIPFMQTVHGTLNALGFGTLTLLGWALKKVNKE